MAREINNHKKADLEMVLCENFTCVHRGDYARCYLNAYKDCPLYVTYLRWKEEQER